VVPPHSEPSQLARSNQGPLILDLETLNYAGMVKCSRALRAAGENASHRRQAASLIIDFFYECFCQPETGKPACALVRCFTTCPYALMPLDYRDAADRLLENIPHQSSMRCLTLLATRGIKPLWNDPTTSVGHQAIPLPSVEGVLQAPMISRLFEQLGMPIENLVAAPSSPDFILDALPLQFNVFHVPIALGSPFIPAQDGFVKSHGVRSVVGMGGLLPDGELFVIILFSMVSVSREVATLFRTLALSVKLSLLRFDQDEVFSERLPGTSA
jgi:two-component system NtrC family sensor kinase